MRTRIALKVFHAIGSGREHRYKGDTKRRALERYERLASSRATHEYWHALMKRIGPTGRASIISRSMPGAAMRILCEEVEGISFSPLTQPTGDE